MKTTAVLVLEDRVSRLERANRWLWVLALLAVAGLTVAATQPTPDVGKTTDVLRARALRILDDSGALAIELTAGEEGPRVSLYDAERKRRLGLEHSGEQTGLFILDEAGHSRIGIAQFAHGGGGVALHGANQKGAAVLYMKTAGSLSFYAPEGEVLLRLPNDETTASQRP